MQNKIDGKWTTCYKLVRQRHDKSLVSVLFSDAIRYRTNQIVQPTVGKLFVFKTMPTVESLYTIIGSMNSHQMYRCQGLNLVDADFMDDVVYDSDRRNRFWADWESYHGGNKQLDMKRFERVVSGTCYVDAVRLTKNVTQEYRKKFSI